MTLSHHVVQTRMTEIKHKLMLLANEAQGNSDLFDMILAADVALETPVPKPMDLNQALDEFSVMDVSDVEPNQNLEGWFAVVDEDGINAYFSTQTAAFRHRLNLINRRLNG